MGFCVSVSNQLRAFCIDQKNENIEELFSGDKMWTKTSKSKILPYNGSSAIAFRKDSKLLIVGFWNGHIYAYSAKSGKMLATIDGCHSDSITCCDFCDLENVPRYLACGSKDGTLSLWLLYE